MASRWFSLLLGVVFLQGVLSSPIPHETSDDEWNVYRSLMRNADYRLPTTTRPSHYEVTLTPYFTGTDAFTFDGEVAITIQPTQANVNQIVLHCNDLTIQTLTVTLSTNTVDLATVGQTFACEMPYSFLRINTNTVLDQTQTYVIRSTFRGNLQTNMRGFYRSWYVDNGGKKWMATTQFQPGYARQAFPCYDEPGFKATFDITLVRDSDFSPSLSNMPLKSFLPLPNGKVSETFNTTPKTSVYLLAFIVSHYDRVATNNDEEKPFDIYARNNIGITGAYSLAVGVPLLEVMSRYTDFPYYDMAPGIAMKQAAIPDFKSGAMENWGLLTYREALILYDPENSNHFYKQRAANIISHEIAHMWFGNLVTCDWWEDLWLNEGFARFYQYFLSDIVAPEMGYETRFIVEQVHTSLLSDSASSAHPLTDPTVDDPDSVWDHFSTITYGKGACVLRMTQHLLGNDTYVKGLRSYLNERKFDIAEPHHLFSALDAAATEDNALTAYDGMTIDRYFKSWSLKAGHPLLTVSVDHATGRMTIIQSRFDRSSGVSESDSLWDIPMTWTRGGSPDFEDLKPSQFITGLVTVIDRGSVGSEWVIFNKQQTGFYRVNYDLDTWALITQALRGEERLLIHEYNRANIVDDVFLFARSGLLTYSRALSILSFLKFEDQYAPWIAAIAGFNFAQRRLAHDNVALQKLRNEIYDLSTTVVDRLGFSEPVGGTYMDELLRMYLMTFLCNAGHEQCIAEGRANFVAWTNGVRIPPNMRPWVYCTGLRYGTAEDFDFFWNRYLEEDLANEKLVMIQAAGCTGVQASLNKFLDAIVSGNDDIRPQDYSAAIDSAVVGNEVNTLRVFQWLQSNVLQTIETLGSLDEVLTAFANRLLTDADITQVQAWLTANGQLLGTSTVTAGTNALANSRANIAWYSLRLTEFDNYFDNGIEESFTDPTSTTESSSTSGSFTTESSTTELSTTVSSTTESSTTESSTTESSTTESSTTESSTTESSTTESSTTESSTTESSTTESSTTESSTTESSTTESSTTESSTTESSTTESSTTESSTTESSTTESSTTESSTTESSTTESSTTESSTTESSTTESSTTESSTTESSTTESSTTESSTTESSTTESSTTESSTTESSTTEPSTTESSTTESSTTESSTTESSTTESSTTESSTTESSTTESSTTESSTTESSTTESSTTESSTTESSTTESSTTESSTTESSTTESSTTESSTTESSTTESSTTEPSTTELSTSSSSTETTTTDDPGSANIASLSIVTLIATLIVNIV